jgi:type I restriction enzyme S subunit
LRFPAATNQAVCGILPNKNYTPEFLYYFLRFYKETLLLEVSGVAQPNLSQIKIKSIPLPLIDVNQQNQLVSKLDAILINVEQVAKSYKNKVDELKILKQSILKQVFTGELVKE